MPGSVGTIFAELDLDASRYTKGQQKLLQDATTTTLNIEQNFKNLGVKSAAEMDLMRAKINNSFDMIKNSSKATADDIVRAEKAKHDQLTKLNEQQYGKQKSMIDGFKDHWIGATVAMAAAAAAASKGWAMLKAGAEYEEQRGILDNLTRKYSTSADSIVADMRRASDGLIANSDLMQIALGGLAKGLNPDQLIKLSSAADILADTVGGTATSALNDLTQALESGRVKGLKAFTGSTIDLKDAFGDLESKLTAAEKTQAMYSLLMIHVTKLQQQQTSAVDSTRDEIERLESQYKNLTTSMAVAFKTAIVGVDSFITRYGKGSIDPITMGANFLASFFEKKGTYGEGVYEVPEIGAKQTADPLQQYNDQLDAIFKKVQTRTDIADGMKKSASEYETALKQMSEETRKAYYEIEGMGKSQYEKDIARIASEEQELRRKTQNDVAVVRWKTAQIALAEAKQSEETTKLWQKSGLEAEEGIKKEVEVGIYQTAESIKRTEERHKAERELYKDLRGYETEAYAASMVLIDEQAKKYKDLGVAEVAVAAWVTEETRKAEIKKLEFSDNFFDGVHAGFLQMKAEALTMGKVGADIFKTFSKESSKALSEGLFQSIKKGSIDAEKIFENFTDSMLRKFTDTAAQMVVEAAMNPIKMTFGAVWNEGAKTVLGVVGKVLGYATDWLFSGIAGSGETWDSLNWTGASRAAYGGWVPGNASVAGNSYANDKIKYLLSPNEYVVDRETTAAIASKGQNGDTMLAHINTAEASLLKALGGSGTVNPRTGLPQFWGFDDFVNVISGGLSNAIGLTNSSSMEDVFDFINPGIQSAESISKAIQNGKWADAIDAAFDPITGPGLTRLTGYAGDKINGVAPWFGTLVDMVAPVVGAVVGGVYGGPWGAAGGAAAGSGFSSKFNKYSSEQAMIKAGVSAAVAYVAGVYTGVGNASEAAVITSDMQAQAAYNAAMEQGMAQGMSESAAEIAAQEAYDAAYTIAWNEAMNAALSNAAGQTFTGTLKSFVTKWAINEALGASFPAENGNLGVSFDGMDSGNLGASMKGNLAKIAPRTDTFAFSAKNGLDYVPRDNFMVRTHKAEAVLKEDEAAAYRAGKYARGGGDGASQPLIINIPVVLNGREIAKVIYDETKHNNKVVHVNGITSI
ncbi:MAG: hypothetical protein CVU71_03625 [Deltaproteobacteria bacterium HGW-Deltaproteobacteria-6]|nr:MAG: hypothetical protein CVU71_03625 [Deltaproteobacteria bacterium HGW-Deltaproteobacteria-6]